MQLGDGLVCSVDADPINYLTPLTSMFLHGGWSHLLGNGLFLWVFGNNVEDSMGRFRFLIFYLLCGLAAAAAQVAVNPAATVPMVGASGAIAGVLGAYLVLYPRVRVNVLFIFIIFFKVIPVPAYLMLLWWIFWQVISGLPQLSAVRDASAGVAFWAHIGGFAAGFVLVKLFENRVPVRVHGGLSGEIFDVCHIVPTLANYGTRPSRAADHDNLPTLARLLKKESADVG